MTFSRLEAMNRYWDENPPIHLLIKSYMGYESKSKPMNDDASAEEMMVSMANFHG